MYQTLSNASLKTGETAEIGVLLAPDADDSHGVGALLGHKGDYWRWHVDEALARELDGIETRYYVALIGGRAVSNVMTVEHAGVGLLGHVFTLPEQRRKGLCQAIFEQLMPDLRARGVERLTLGTGYDSAPYWIYHRAGFRSVLPESGFMKIDLRDDFAPRWFAPGAVTPAAFTWRHWPTASQLFAEDIGQGLTLYGAGAFGAFNFEGLGLQLLKAIADGRPLQVWVLEKDNSAVVGLASLRPDDRWGGRVHLLDLVGHADFGAELPRLLEHLTWPAAKVQCYLPTAAEARCAAVEACGFQREGVLRRQLAGGGDVALYARE
ncbi:MAG: hypothetical protein HUU35_01970 [Armatimonadetes bacterium]|nr:hypothetical protein [Armatimonadota bacterium]